MAFLPTAAFPQVSIALLPQARRGIALVGTLLSFGTNRLVGRGAAWLKRNGLVRYAVPLLLVNEAFGAYRAYAAGAAIGWW